MNDTQGKGSSKTSRRLEDNDKQIGNVHWLHSNSFFFGCESNLSKTKIYFRVKAQFVWKLEWTPPVNLALPLETEDIVRMGSVFVPKKP